MLMSNKHEENVRVEVGEEDLEPFQEYLGIILTTKELRIMKQGIGLQHRQIHNANGFRR